MVSKRYLLVLCSIILFTFIFVLFFSNIKLKEHIKVFEYFNSYEEIRIYTYSEKKAEKAFEYIENLLNEYDSLVSTSKKKNNNTYMINKGEDILEIDNKLYKLIEYGMDLNNLSNGYININNYEFVDTFNKAKIKKVIPNYKNINLNKIDLLPDNKIDSSTCKLEFSPIIKLYVGDLIKEYLEENDITCYTINFLGSAIVGENKNSSFNVAIEKPFTNFSEYITILALNNKTISTVGPYQNYYELDNKIYHSLIDYNTNKMLTNYNSVTVVADTPKLANILSFMLYFVSIEEGTKILEDYNADALWYTLDGEVIYSDGMKEYLANF